MRITVLSGGVGGARFVSGLLDQVGDDADVTVVANTADDLWLFGLRVCPDLDTLMYTLGDGIDTDRGWGRRDETWAAKSELAAYGADRSWFGLGDRDLGTHLYRTELLRSGRRLTEVTETLCRRWDLPVRLVPMTDDEVETHVRTVVDGVETVIHFQEFWIRHQAGVPVRGLELRGIDTAHASAAALEAIAGADVVLVPPSNPVVSVGPILALYDLKQAVRSTAAPVVGVSPIIAGGAVRGMAEQLLRGLGHDVSAAAVGRLHGARSADGVLDGWLVDTADASAVDDLAPTGLAVRAVPLWMRDRDTTRQLAADAMALAEEVRS